MKLSVGRAPWPAFWPRGHPRASLRFPLTHLPSYNYSQSKVPEPPPPIFFCKINESFRLWNPLFNGGFYHWLEKNRFAPPGYWLHITQRGNDKSPALPDTGPPRRRWPGSFGSLAHNVRRVAYFQDVRMSRLTPWASNRGLVNGQQRKEQSPGHNTGTLAGWETP